MFGIVITVYRRKDGKSPEYLKRCLEGVKNQTNKNCGVIVVGDEYNNDTEIKSMIPSNMLYVNKSSSYERRNYTGEKLWCCGGLHSTLYGIRLLLTEGVYKLILLDYDDYWSPDHLEAISSVPKGFACAFTKSTYKNKGHLPKYNGNKEIVKMIPRPQGIIKSSVCWDFEQVPLVPRNVFEETGKVIPSDADLWKRIAEYIQKHRLDSYFINKLTCFHDEEKYILKEESKNKND